MEKKISQLSSIEWQQIFPGLDREEFFEQSGSSLDKFIVPEEEKQLTEDIRASISPEIPDEFRNRLRAKIATSENNSRLERMNSPTVDTTKQMKTKSSTIALVLVSAGMAAAFVAMVAFPEKRGSAAPPTVNVLTPAEETTFQQPVFIWEGSQAEPLSLAIFSGAGRDRDLIGELSGVYSPIAADSFDEELKFRKGEIYTFDIIWPEDRSVLVSASFTVVGSGSLIYKGALDKIVGQCETLLASGFPADAWMVWAGLTKQQKSDQRMQQLRTQILRELQDA